MAFGLTSTGFNIKRLEDIKSEMEVDLRSTFGEIQTTGDSVFGQLIGVEAKHLADIWEELQNVYLSQYPASAEDFSLDNVAQITGITRLPATHSSGVLQLVGDDSTIVPEGTVFAQEDGGLEFTLDADTTISDDILHKVKVTIIATSGPYGFRVIDQGGTQILGAAGSYYADPVDTAAVIAGSIPGSLSGFATVSYTTGDAFFWITIDDKNLTDYFTVTEDYSGIELTTIYTPASYTASDLGAVPVPVASIDTIITPVTGLDSVTNLAEGDIGRETETDDELRLRRTESLQIIGAGTVEAIRSRLLQEIEDENGDNPVNNVFVFENRTDSTDGDGRPPHSFEVVINATSGTDIDTLIAEKIWEVKPAGIQTYGTTSVNIEDASGTTQSISFTRSTSKYIHIKVEYDTTGAEGTFPSTGEDAIETEVLRIGALHAIGEDVLLGRFVSAGYIAGGVTDVTIKAVATDEVEAQLLTFDADLVTSNDIDFTVNGQSISTVTFATDHNTTMEAVRAAIEGLSSVTEATLPESGGTNRVIQIVAATFTSPTCAVTNGATQAGATFTDEPYYGTSNLTMGISETPVFLAENVDFEDVTP